MSPTGRHYVNKSWQQNTEKHWSSVKAATSSYMLELSQEERFSSMRRWRAGCLQTGKSGSERGCRVIPKRDIRSLLYRFKPWFRYNSLTYPQSGFGIEPCGPAPQGKNRQAKQWAKLTLAKIGAIWMNIHRPLKGVIKTCTISRSATGKWYVSFSCDEVEPELLPESEEEVGIDVGLKTFAYLSTGEQIEHPRFFRAEEQALARAQRRLSKAAKGTHKRKKRRKVVARIHERIKNRRQNFIHQQVSWLISRFGLIAVE